MTRLVPCAVCGAVDDVSICAHHEVRDTSWAASNRASCDFFHRGILHPELESEDERRSRAEELAWLDRFERVMTSLNRLLGDVG